MKFMQNWERRLANQRQPNLLLWLVAIYAIGGALFMTQPQTYAAFFSLDFEKIVTELQIWRLITFLLYPLSMSPLYIILSLYIYFLMARFMERIFGTFRLNVFVVTGIVMIWIVSALAYYVFDLPVGRMGYLVGTNSLNLSLFLLLALSIPEQQFLFYFLIPIKAKYIAILDLIFFLISLYGGGGPRIEAIAALLNVGLFFLLFVTKHHLALHRRQVAFQKSMRQERTKAPTPQPEKMQKPVAKHRCEVCGITDLDDPNMTFRFCSKCHGLKEYCEEHIHDHTHQ